MNKTLTKITTQPLFELPEVRVVEASAGSGKTYALAKRYVQLLLNPALPLDQVPIRQVLAITFTNKASFEMKERILEFLKSIALGQMPAWQVEDMIKPLGISLPEARKKAYAVMEDIIRSYNFFQVQTIDKFINALLSGCAFKLGVTANFKIKTNVQEYLLYSLDQLIDQAADNKDLSGLFEEFLHHYLYLENRTGWFPKDDILSIISMLFSQNSSYGDDFVASVINSREIIKKKSIILADIKSLKEELPEGTDTRFLKSLEKFLKDHEKSFDVDSLSDYFARESVPVKKNTEVSNNLRGLWDKIRRGICQLCEQESASLFNPYLAIYQQTLNIFYQTASRDDVLFLNELNKRAAALFDEEQVTVEELYYRLATRFHHYLIDEFQDTSYLQWYNLRAMVEEGLSSGGSLFYVGDKKQAIYGFRGGEAALFEDVKAAFDAFNVKTEYLTKNWRSHKEIVDFNNMVFDMDNLRRFIEEKQNYEEQKKKKNPVVFHETDYGELGNVFGSARQSHREEYSKGYVRMEYVDIEKKAERDDYLRGKIIQLIKELKDRFHYKDIAILTRGNKEIEEITGWLLQENIQVDSERTSNVKENHLIVEIVSFLRFLSSPIDNVAFVDFILGGVFSRATGLPSEDMHAFVFSLRDKMRHENDVYVYREFRDRFPDVWKTFIEEFFDNVGLYPLYELVVSFYTRYTIWKNFPQYQGFFMHFLEMIKNEEEEHADIAAFLDYFENSQGESLFVQTADADAVKVLTIHKSKGLEFPVVILPYLGMDIQVGYSSDNKQSYVLRHADDDIRLAKLKNKYYPFSDDLYQIYAEEYKKSLMTELNNVYVALTRPQYELYGFIPKRVGNSFNFVKFLLPSENYIAGEQCCYGVERQQDQKVDILSCDGHYNWIEYLKEEFADSDTLRHRSQRLRGDVLHRILANIECIHGENLEELIDSALDHVFMEQEDIKEERNECRTMIMSLLQQPQIRPFFECSDAEIFTEKEVINTYGHTKRIDRLLVNDTEVAVVDFKSSRDGQGQYQKQVREYMAIMEKIYPNRMIRGILIYFDDYTVEEVSRDERE